MAVLVRKTAAAVAGTAANTRDPCTLSGIADAIDRQSRESEVESVVVQPPCFQSDRVLLERVQVYRPCVCWHHDRALLEILNEQRRSLDSVMA